MGLFDRCVDPNLLIRRITVVAAHVLNEKDVPAAPEEQSGLFTDYEALEKQKAAEQAELDKERRLYIPVMCKLVINQLQSDLRTGHHDCVKWF